MVEITWNDYKYHESKLKLLSLSEEKITPFLKDAAIRAAIHAREVGKKRIRGIYTIDSSSIREAIIIGGGCSGIMATRMGGAILRIKGKRKGLNHYKARQTQKGVFASLKKGSGKTIHGSFSWNGTFFRRGGDRLPINKLVGLAVPQLFQNPAILTEMQKEAMQMYEKRVEHELSRL